MRDTPSPLTSRRHFDCLRLSPRTAHSKTAQAMAVSDLTSGCAWLPRRCGNVAGVAQPLGELGEISDVTSFEWTRVSLSSPHHAGASPVLFTTAMDAKR